MSDVKCNVIIDSCCDLPPQVIDVPGVEVLQFPYLIDDEQRIDDMFQSVPAHEFYERMRKGASLSTAQIPIPVITDAFTRAIESGIPTVYLGFASALSGTFDTISLIRDQLVAEHPETTMTDSIAAMTVAIICFLAIPTTPYSPCCTRLSHAHAHSFPQQPEKNLSTKCYTNIRSFLWYNRREHEASAVCA